MKYLFIAFFLVLFSSCKNDDGMNTGMAYLSLGKSAPLYFIGGSQDGADSLLVSLAYPNFRHMDTTFMFFDADDGRYSITY